MHEKEKKIESQPCKIYLRVEEKSKKLRNILNKLNNEQPQKFSFPIVFTAQYSEHCFCIYSYLEYDIPAP